MNRNRHSRGSSAAVMSASASASLHTPVSSASSLGSIVAVFLFLAAALTVAAQSPTIDPMPEMGHIQFPYLPQMTEAPSASEVEFKFDRRNFVMNTNTCGFVSGGVSNPWTCYHTDASCTTFGYALGCCDTTLACTHTFITKCFDYTSVQSGACKTANLNTLCCQENSPSCFGWRSTTNAIAVTAWNCLGIGGFGLLVSTPEVAETTPTTIGSFGLLVSTPEVAETTPTTTLSSSSSSSLPVSSPFSSSSSSSSPSPPRSHPSSLSLVAPGNPGQTSPTVITTSPPTVNPSSSTPVGAIVGGVLGGLAVIAAIVFAVGLYCYRRRCAGAAGMVEPGPAGPPVGYPPPMGYAAVPPGPPQGPGPVPPYNPHTSYYGGPNTQPVSTGAYYYDPSKSGMYPSGPNSPNSAEVAPHMQPNSPSQFTNAELQATDVRVGTMHNPAQLS